MSEVSLLVNGYSYTGWKDVGVIRTIESLAGSFSLSVADNQADAAVGWPIRTEDECRVKIDDQTVIDGWIGTDSPSFSGTTKAQAYKGKDRTAALVECSAFLNDWTFLKHTVVDIARKLADPYGIKVSVQPGLELLKAPRKVVVSQGETAFSVLDTVAKASGVIVVSDGSGGILITRSGIGRASQELIEERGDFLSGGIDYEASERFFRYVVSTQIPSTDNASGKSARIRAEAIDEGVRRTDRALLIRPDTGMTKDYARQRADWEARIRAARAASPSVGVHGWQQSDGQLWPLNVLMYVKSKTLRIDGDMLISRADHTKGNGESGGEVTTLRLVRPDAFTPEPQARVKA